MCVAEPEQWPGLWVDNSEHCSSYLTIIITTIKNPPSAKQVLTATEAHYGSYLSHRSILALVWITEVDSSKSQPHAHT